MSPIIGSFASGSAFGAKGGKAPLQGLYDFTDAQFVANKYGSSGPNLTQARGGISSPSGGNLDWINDTNFFNVTTGIQYWTVPYTATYQIEAWGGVGRTGSSGTGGYGSRMRGDFDLTEGEIIRFIIGQWPEHTGVYGPPNPYGGGGAGGTFVVRSPYNSNASILLIAGGGCGGARGNYPGAHAVTTTTTPSGPAAGQGGGQSNQHGGAGGGGFFGNGPQSRPNGYYGRGGFSWNNGGRGGDGSQSYGNRGGQAPSAVYGEGGFGGGGGVDHQGGGGGGYTGGRYANFSTGSNLPACSYNNGVNQLNYGGSQTQAQSDRPTSGVALYGGKLVITVLA